MELVESDVNVERLSDGPDSRYRVFVEATGLEPVVMREGALGQILALVYEPDEAALLKEAVVDHTGRLCARPWLKQVRVPVLRAMIAAYGARR